MADGMATPDLPSGFLTHILGNATLGGLSDTAIEEVSDFLERASVSGPIANRLDLLEGAQQSGYLTYEAWVLLSATPPTVAGATARVRVEDAGTHTDPVVGGTVPNSGEYRGSLSPLGWKRIGPLPVTDVPTAIAGATPVTELDDDDAFVVRRASDGALLKITKSFFEGLMAGPVTYSWPADVTVGATSKEIIPYDEGLLKPEIYNGSDSNIYVAEGGAQASIGPDSYMLVPGGLYAPDVVIPGAISAISEGTSRIKAKFRTTTDFNIAGRALAQAYIDRVIDVGGALSTDEQNALRDFYSAMYSVGALSALGCFYNLLAPGAARLVNLCHLEGALGVSFGGVTGTDWRHTAFNGSSGYVDTGVYLKDFARLDDHSLLCYPADETLQGSSRVAIGDGNVTLTPARTSTTVAGRSVTASNAIATGIDVGSGLISMSRVSQSALVFRGGPSSVVSVPLDAGENLSTRTLLIGARNNAVAGGTADPASGSFFTGPMVAAGAGRKLSDAQHTAIDAAIGDLVIAAGAFS